MDMKKVIRIIVILLAVVLFFVAVNYVSEFTGHTITGSSIQGVEVTENLDETNQIEEIDGQNQSG